MLRRLRIFALLLLLLIVGIGAWLDQRASANWSAPFVVALYPINGDGSALSTQYIEKLGPRDFESLESFFQEEGVEYGLKVERPIRITLAKPLSAMPPLPPTENPNIVSIALWSLRFRWWAWITPPKPPGPTPRIRMFLLFHDPSTSQVLKHSTGLTKGRIGIAHLFATSTASGSNLTVVAHELLHTLGATDKYDLRTTLPHYPEGFAEPNAHPRFPQRFAELMGGRIPISPSRAEIPEALSQVVIGPTTAAEIGWTQR